MNGVKNKHGSGFLPHASCALMMLNPDAIAQEKLWNGDIPHLLLLIPNSFEKTWPNIERLKKIVKVYNRYVYLATVSNPKVSILWGKLVE